MTPQAPLPEARLNQSLGQAVFRGLRRDLGRVAWVDHTQERRELKAGLLLAAALSLAERWRYRLPARRVGVVLPPGLGSTLVNLALVLLDRVPVNLNFTAGRRSLELSLAAAGIETVITAAPVRQKFPDFPWPADTLDLLRERQAMPKPGVLGRLLLLRLLPGAWAERFFGVPRGGDAREAGLLFSSGSTGDPKGVVLTHRNVLANCLQIEACRLLGSGEVLLANLPTFHSFGFTVTLWYPLIAGVRVVSLPSPLDTKRTAEVVAAEGCTVLLGTPTFLRPHLQRTEPAQLRSLKFVVAGAEKTPEGLAEAWERRFGSRYLEGYGLTETAPVASVNLALEDDAGRPRWRAGSVGRLLPGMECRLVDPVTGEARPTGAVGMLELRGPNVFPGYLNQPELSQTVFREGWFVTGDLARLDEDGFLWIEGRLSRFSKIGGEMVPHGTVEHLAARALGLEAEDAPRLAVTGVTDAQKGEALVLLSTVPLEAEQVRLALAREGLSNLWIPRRILQVPAIPMLPTGKLDLRSLRALAEQPPRS